MCLITRFGKNVKLQKRIIASRATKYSNFTNVKNSRQIVLFASGNGSNAENIIRYTAARKDISIPAIFCNKPGAGVIGRAGELGVPVRMFSREDMDSGRLLQMLREYEPSLLVLAGFLWLLPSGVVSSYRNRIINIHPALLPAYGGKGMYGARVHRAVIDAGEQESGITIHYVNEKYDEGDIIYQATCPVLPGDTPDILAARIHELEYRYFPPVIMHVLKKLPAEIK